MSNQRKIVTFHKLIDLYLPDPDDVLLADNRILIASGCIKASNRLRSCQVYVHSLETLLLMYSGQSISCNFHSLFIFKYKRRL